MTPSIRAITTCSAAGWRQYGRRMVTSWTRHWPVPLTVWAEGFACDVPNVEVCDLTRIDWLQRFKTQHRACMPPGPYNYRFDAVRFAHKTAAVIETALACGEDYLIWVDADTFTHADVPPSFVRMLLPRGDEFIAWLDRVGNYPECGFYALNLQHAMHPDLILRWRNLYLTGDVFKMSEWHDSFVLQQMVAQAGARTKSLSGPRAALTGHPFINGPLGAYMDHMKGDRKQRGISRRRDLKTARPEPYWRNAR